MAPLGIDMLAIFKKAFPSRISPRQERFAFKRNQLQIEPPLTKMV